jgi:hypothetical protein
MNKLLFPREEGDALSLSLSPSDFDIEACEDILSLVSSALAEIGAAGSYLDKFLHHKAIQQVGTIEKLVLFESLQQRESMKSILEASLTLMIIRRKYGTLKLLIMIKRRKTR